MEHANNNLDALTRTASRHGLVIADLDIIPDPSDKPILHVSYGPGEDEYDSYWIDDMGE